MSIYLKICLIRQSNIDKLILSDDVPGLHKTPCANLQDSEVMMVHVEIYLEILPIQMARTFRSLNPACKRYFFSLRICVIKKIFAQ